MKPLNDFVIVEPIERNDEIKQQFKHIVVQAPKNQGQPLKGFVRFISDELQDTQYKIGDTVVFKEDQPSGFKYDGVGYFALHHKQILGVINA